MKDMFEVAAGSIVGRDHSGRGNLLFGKNNQDVFYYSQEDISIGIVCDGCSEGSYSEFGARVGASLILNSLWDKREELQDRAFDSCVFQDMLEQTRVRVLNDISRLAISMARDVGVQRVISEYFLFTTLGTIITPALTCVFSIGDGMYFLNGDMHRIGPFPGNMPPYLSYGLVKSKIDPGLLRFSVNALVSTRDVQTVCIGTDGLADLCEAQEKCVPGRTEKVGPVSQFWHGDHFFRGPDQIRRRLALINSEVVKRDHDTGDVVRYPGLLPDDTTCIVFRRKSLETERSDDNSDSGRKEGNPQS